MTPEDRIDRARGCIKELTYRVQIVLELHAANEILQYTDTLSGQIPPSYAAVAHDIFRDAMFHQEIIRLLALWDKPETNAISVPLAAALINDAAVIDLICKDIFSAHEGRGVRVLNPSEDPDIQKAIEEAIRDSQQQFAKRQSEKAASALAASIQAVEDLKVGALAEGLKNLRDRVAHSVTNTRQELAGKTTRAKYGQEKEVLLKTVSVIEDLYCWVNGTSFDIRGDCLELARKHAKEFWTNLRFVGGEPSV